MADYRYYLGVFDTDSDQGSIVSVSTNATADNLPGPGRIIGNIYGSLGRLLEIQAGRIAETLGRGPHVTAIRIQRRREVIASASLSKLPTIKAENERLEKDCKRMLKYATSQVPLTSRQALDHITNFAVSDQHVRGLFNSMDATRIIGRIHKHSAVWFDSDGLLLNSSRKALVSLADTEIHGLARKLETLNFYDQGKDQVVYAVKECLSDSSRSFLFLRYFARTVMDVGWARRILLEHLLDDLLIRISANPEAFEWDMVDTLLGQSFAHTKARAVFYSEVSSRISEFILCPFLGGHDAGGDPSYVADDHPFGGSPTAISERELCEISRSQEEMRHGVYVLRYALEMYLSIVDDGRERFEATGPYAWSPLDPDMYELAYAPFAKWERESEGYLSVKIREALERRRLQWNEDGSEDESGLEDEDEGESKGESESEDENRDEDKDESESLDSDSENEDESGGEGKCKSETGGKDEPY
ncbi:hypothetical protein M0805_001644 [Coniferiporia weirii]|nr:hypothetical protein M0805_001644 [Coniferiporia weirii]